MQKISDYEAPVPVPRKYPVRKFNYILSALLILLGLYFIVGLLGVIPGYQQSVSFYTLAVILIFLIILPLASLMILKSIELVESGLLITYPLLNQTKNIAWEKIIHIQWYNLISLGPYRMDIVVIKAKGHWIKSFNSVQIKKTKKLIKDFQNILPEVTNEKKLF